MYVHKNKDQYTKRKIQTPKNIDFRFLLARSQNYEKWLLNSQYFFLRPSAISEKSVHARRIYMTFDIELFFERPPGKIKVSLRYNNNNMYFIWWPLYSCDYISFASSSNEKFLQTYV